MSLFGRRKPREEPEVLSEFAGVFREGPNGVWEEIEEDKDVRLSLAKALRYAADKLEEETCQGKF